MGDRKRDICKAGLHRMEGKNLIHRPDGTRCCRACQYARDAKHKRDQRRPRMRWGKFSTEELVAIYEVFMKCSASTLPPNLFSLARSLFRELMCYRDSLRGPDPQPVQSTPNHQTLSNKRVNDPKLANQKQH
jgi:hypothetical protein